MIDPEEIDEDEGWATYREHGVSRTVRLDVPAAAEPAPPVPAPPLPVAPVAGGRRGRWIAAGAAALVAAEVIRRRR